MKGRQPRCAISALRALDPARLNGGTSVAAVTLPMFVLLDGIGYAFQQLFYPLAMVSLFKGADPAKKQYSASKHDQHRQGGNQEFSGCHSGKRLEEKSVQGSAGAAKTDGAVSLPESPEAMSIGWRTA
ncbi:MAG: hypothetical protein IPJ21_08325 [Sterolibacteriaceae bacterium]|nr:hypothetical protein [Sterolibacteriaceae bacterium]MBK9083872.1 hypothetical protein [Sterolibacteriaceae bacterium]